MTCLPLNLKASDMGLAISRSMSSPWSPFVGNGHDGRGAKFHFTVGPLARRFSGTHLATLHYSASSKLNYTSRSGPRTNGNCFFSSLLYVSSGIAGKELKKNQDFIACPVPKFSSTPMVKLRGIVSEAVGPLAPATSAPLSTARPDPTRGF